MSWMALEVSKMQIFSSSISLQKLLKHGHLQVGCFKSLAKRQMQIPGYFSKGKGEKK